MSQKWDLRLQKPHVDQDPLNLGSQAATTTDASSTSNANTHDDQSTSQRRGKRRSFSAYSYRSDLDACQFLRQVDGRLFNSLNDTYFMPSDDNEWTRLNKQHIAFVLAFGGLCPASDVVNAVLASQEGVRKKILDIGSGTGAWALDMAKKFPHADSIGIDVAPAPVDPENVPANCRFEIDDIELGLSHYWNQFDLVHARMITTGLKDSEKSMNDIYKCLKPGGLMIWIEADHSLFTPDIHTYRSIASDENPTGTWVGRIIHEMKRAGAMVGRSDFAVMERTLDGGFWEHPLFDPETCKTASVYLPIGPWASHEDISVTQRLKYIGALMRQNIRELHVAGRLVLTKVGWPVGTLSDWIRRAEEEISSLKSPLHTRLRVAWGRRRAAPGQPAPLLPPTPSTTIEEDLSLLSYPYPFIYVYDTQEQALAEDALRKRSKEGSIEEVIEGSTRS